MTTLKRVLIIGNRGKQTIVNNMVNPDGYVVESRIFKQNPHVSQNVNGYTIDIRTQVPAHDSHIPPYMTVFVVINPYCDTSGGIEQLQQISDQIGTERLFCVIPFMEGMLEETRVKYINDLNRGALGDIGRRLAQMDHILFSGAVESGIVGDVTLTRYRNNVVEMTNKIWQKIRS